MPFEGGQAFWIERATTPVVYFIHRDEARRKNFMGLKGESNPRPRPPEGRIMPLDQIPNLGPFRFEGTGVTTQILVLE